MQYFKYLVALITLVFIGLGCGDPEVYLVKDGESEFHLQWTEPLKEQRIVLFHRTRFDYYGSQITNSVLYFFPVGEFRSRLFRHNEVVGQNVLLSVELPPASTRDTFDRPNTVWDATTEFTYIDTVLVGHPYRPYDVGKPSKITFDYSIDAQQIYLEKEYEFSTNSEGKSTYQGYGLYLVWKPGNLRIVRYVLVRITPSGQTPEESLIFFPRGTTSLKLLHHFPSSPTERGSATAELRERNKSPMDKVLGSIWTEDKEWIQKWFEARARVFRHDPDYSIVEILRAEKLNKLKLPTTASNLGSNESVDVSVKHKFLPYDVGTTDTHRGSKVTMSGSRR